MDKITPVTTRLLLVTMIFAAFAALTVFVSRTEQLLSVHARYWVYAIPAAISETVHGARGFVIFDEITSELATAAAQNNIEAQNTLIGKAAAKSIPSGSVFQETRKGLLTL